MEVFLSGLAIVFSYCRHIFHDITWPSVCGSRKSNPIGCNLGFQFPEWANVLVELGVKRLGLGGQLVGNVRMICQAVA